MKALYSAMVIPDVGEAVQTQPTTTAQYAQSAGVCEARKMFLRDVGRIHKIEIVVLEGNTAVPGMSLTKEVVVRCNGFLPKG